MPSKEFAVTLTLVYQVENAQEAMKRAHDLAISEEGSPGYLGYREMKLKGPHLVNLISWPKCPECGKPRPGDERVGAGMKCYFCAYGE